MCLWDIIPDFGTPANFKRLYQRHGASRGNELAQRSGTACPGIGVQQVAVESCGEHNMYTCMACPIAQVKRKRSYADLKLVVSIRRTLAKHMLQCPPASASEVKLVHATL